VSANIAVRSIRLADEV